MADKNLYILAVNNQSIVNRLIHRGYKQYEIFDVNEPVIVVDKISRTYFSMPQKEVDEYNSLSEVGNFYKDDIEKFFSVIDNKISN